MDNNYIEKTKKYRLGEVKTYVKNGYVYMEEDLVDPYPGYYVCDYSYELSQDGWEHVLSQFHMDWTVHVVHRKPIPEPMSKWEKFKSKIFKLWKKS